MRSNRQRPANLVKKVITAFEPIDASGTMAKEKLRPGEQSATFTMSGSTAGWS